MTIDNRQKAIDELTARILRGDKLTDEERFETLSFALDQVLLSLARSVAGGHLEDMTQIEMVRADGSRELKRKDVVRLYNCLQNAYDRQVLKRGGSLDNPLDALAREWTAACDRAKSEM